MEYSRIWVISLVSLLIFQKILSIYFWFIVIKALLLLLCDDSLKSTPLCVDMAFARERVTYFSVSKQKLLSCDCVNMSVDEHRDESFALEELQ